MPPRGKGKNGRPRLEPETLSERVTITLPASLVESIDRLADINGQSRAYIIRRSLEEWVPKHEHLARSLIDPFLGTLRRRFVALIAKSIDDPERLHEVYQILDAFEKKSEEERAQKKAKLHAQP